VSEHKWWGGGDRYRYSFISQATLACTALSWDFSTNGFQNITDPIQEILFPTYCTTSNTQVTPTCFGHLQAVHVTGRSYKAYIYNYIYILIYIHSYLIFK